MYKLSITICVLLIGGCAKATLELPVGGPIVVKDEDGSVVRQCQIVIANGEPKTDCNDMFINRLANLSNIRK